MAKLKISPQDINIPEGGGFWKQLGMMVLGTTISLFLTIAVAALLDRQQRAKDRNLSAMMVMSNIEKFSRNLEEIANYMAKTDNAATLLLNTSDEELELMSRRN